MIPLRVTLPSRVSISVRVPSRVVKKSEGQVNRRQYRTVNREKTGPFP